MTPCVTSNHLRSFIWSHRMCSYITGSQSLSVSKIWYTLYTLYILSKSRTLSFAWTHYIFQTRLEVQISFQTSGCLNWVNYYGISQDLSNNRAGGGQDKSTVWSTFSEVLILTASTTSTGEFLGGFFSIFEVPHQVKSPKRVLIRWSSCSFSRVLSSSTYFFTSNLCNHYKGIPNMQSKVWHCIYPAINSNPRP